MMKSLDNSKIIALKLSSLNQSDFDWIYSQLSQDVKDSLNPLIKEINSIGFKVDSKDIDALIGNDLTNKLLESGEQESISLINNSSYGEIMHLFNSEPAFLFKTLSNLGVWSWVQDPKFTSNIKVNTAKEIKNIASKRLLAKSIRSTTSLLLRESKKQELKNTTASQFQMSRLLSSIFSDFTGLRKKWRF